MYQKRTDIKGKKIAVGRNGVMAHQPDEKPYEFIADLVPKPIILQPLDLSGVDPSKLRLIGSNAVQASQNVVKIAKVIQSRPPVDKAKQLLQDAVIANEAAQAHTSVSGAGPVEVKAAAVSNAVLNRAMVTVAQIDHAAAVSDVQKLHEVALQTASAANSATATSDEKIVALRAAEQLNVAHDKVIAASSTVDQAKKVVQENYTNRSASLIADKILNTSQAAAVKKAGIIEKLTNYIYNLIYTKNGFFA